MITRAMRRAFEAEQARQPARLTCVAPADWPEVMRNFPRAPLEVWRSKTFLVQIYQEPAHLRMTVNRAALTGSDWSASITWDELQECKRQVGRAECWAVEVFPPDTEVVNVANMRHLWLLPEVPAFGWRHG